eukprot:Nk52_evm22s2085 gene=Nk52_evmTU22s2085
MSEPEPEPMLNFSTLADEVPPMESEGIPQEDTKPKSGADQTEIEIKGMLVSFMDVNYSIGLKKELTFSERVSLFTKERKIRAPVEEKNILKGVSGSIKPGVMTALMGPSGAGKSTLLDVLAGRKTKGTITGTIRFDGKEAPQDFKQIAAYVQQTDTLMPTLKVRELLQYTAQLKLSSRKFTREQKEARVEAVINELGLQGCADTVIGDRLTRGISGGQAKRVNIAMELVTNPSIIFLDEPTTGLDSGIALEVMTVVRSLTNGGRSVICTIHQPSGEIFQLFDRLLLLVLGEVVYEGERRLAVDYFRNFGYALPPGMNPSDYLMDIVGEDMEDGERLVPGERRDPSFFVEEYKKSTVYQDRLVSVRKGIKPLDTEQSARRPSFETCPQDLAKVKSPFANGFGHELRVLCQRGFRGKTRDQTYIMNAIIKYTIFGLIFMSIYWDSALTSTGMRDRFSFIFLSAVILAFSAFDFLPGLLMEREFFYRERSSGTYRVSSYVLANTITGAPFAFIGVIIYGCITYYAVGMDETFSNFIYFMVMLIVLQDLGLAMGHASSSIFPDLDSATAFLNVFLTIYLFFSGYGIRGADTPHYWLWAYWTSFVRYGVEGLSVNEFKGNWYGVCNNSTQSAETDPYYYACKYNPETGTSQYSGAAFNDNLDMTINKWATFGIVCGFTVFLHIATYFGTRFVSFNDK